VFLKLGEDLLGTLLLCTGASEKGVDDLVEEGYVQIDGEVEDCLGNVDVVSGVDGRDQHDRHPASETLTSIGGQDLVQLVGGM
jgi:hypothetical protein